ncbi:hypothetical protein O1611_g2576 [Lasiodiplodia mahajangana]|uniref:Uncharacterized protein n=1 Tax=Lasiodiplodia mahajangana TaxID=1108764 RepID=A0ACC2JUB0_9PEZI|nr:hypothetical protein O1611_g2576 [Lasiodiplodia mahajangana]
MFKRRYCCQKSTAWAADGLDAEKTCCMRDASICRSGDQALLGSADDREDRDSFFDDDELPEATGQIKVAWLCLGLLRLVRSRRGSAFWSYAYGDDDSDGSDRDGSNGTINVLRTMGIVLGLKDA